MDFLDKIAAFLEELEEQDVSLSNQDGDTAVVCNDCVAVVSKKGDEVSVNFINRVKELNFTAGFTAEDVEEFKLVDALMGGEESAGD